MARRKRRKQPTAKQRAESIQRALNVLDHDWHGYDRGQSPHALAVTKVKERFPHIRNRTALTIVRQEREGAKRMAEQDEWDAMNPF